MGNYGMIPSGTERIINVFTSTLNRIHMDPLVFFCILKPRNFLMYPHEWLVYSISDMLGNSPCWHAWQFPMLAFFLRSIPRVICCWLNANISDSSKAQQWSHNTVDVFFSETMSATYSIVWCVKYSRYSPVYPRYTQYIPITLQ